jgi:hypothetical protein
VILRLVLLLLAGLAGLAPSAAAHEIRPAFLQIREIEPQVYDFLWKTNPVVFGHKRGLSDYQMKQMMGYTAFDRMNWRFSNGY